MYKFNVCCKHKKYIALCSNLFDFIVFPGFGTFITVPKTLHTVTCLKEWKVLQTSQNFDPIDAVQEAVQLKPKASDMSDLVNYSKHQLLTPR